MARAANPNLCMDCERLMEDSSPVRAAHTSDAEAERSLPENSPAEVEQPVEFARAG